MSHSMYFAQVIASINLSAGGTGRFMSDICNYLPNTKDSYSLLTSLGCDDEADDLPVDSRVEVIKLKRKKKYRFLCGTSRKDTINALTHFSSKKHIDVVHIHGIWLNICKDAAHWARLQKTNLVISPHGMLEAWALNHKKWKKSLAMWMYQRRDLQSAVAFHACSDLEAESIRRLGFKQPIAVIPNGVELPAFKSEASEVSSDLKPNVKTALFLSRINPKKGLPMFLDAWKQVAPQSWRLVIAGNDDSEHLPVLRKKIKEQELSNYVEIAGPLFGEDKEQAYLNADLFVLPSYSENFGIVVTEALSYRLPVLTTTGCPWQELVTEHCGWWVEPTLDGIKAGLKAAFEISDIERQEMGMRGRALVEKSYLWPAIAENMSRFYKWILNKGDKPDFVI